MSRCLSDDALERDLAERASVAERAHLAGCGACATRRQAPVRRRRWMPATVALAAVAAALLIWVEVAVWRAVTPVPPTMQPHEVAAILADVSAALFSVSGDPPVAAAEDPRLSLEVMAQEMDHALTGGEP
jgi:hypothetical protein